MTTEYKNIVVSLAAKLGNFVPTMKKAGDAAAASLASMSGAGGGGAADQFGKAAMPLLNLTKGLAAVQGGMSAVAAMSAAAHGEWVGMLDACEKLPLGIGAAVGVTRLLVDQLIGWSKAKAAILGNEKFQTMIAPGTEMANNMRKDANNRVLALQPGFTEADARKIAATNTRDRALADLAKMQKGTTATGSSIKNARAAILKAYDAEIIAADQEWAKKLEANEAGAMQGLLDAMDADSKHVSDAVAAVIDGARRDSALVGKDSTSAALYDLFKGGADEHQMFAAAMALTAADAAKEASDASKALADWADQAKDGLKTTDERLKEYRDQTAKGVAGGKLTAEQAAALNAKKMDELSPGKSDFGILGSRMSMAALAGNLGGKDDAVAKNTSDMVPLLKSIDKRLADADNSPWSE
jgi:hypothetical protein